MICAVENTDNQNADFRTFMHINARKLYYLYAIICAICTIFVIGPSLITVNTMYKY